MDPIETVAAGYDRLAAVWDDWACEVNPDLRLEYTRRLTLDVDGGANVVELGCGTGRPVGCALAQTFDYVGVDVSPEMVRIASENCPDGQFFVGDMTSLSFPDASLAGVVAFHSIIHVPREYHAGLFQDVYRWLQAGGWFVASLGTTAQDAGTDPDWLGAGMMFWSGWDTDENQRLLRDAGFTIDSAQVIRQMEPDRNPVEFQWVICQKPHI